MDSLGLQGYTGASGRGTVSGSYSGTLSGPAVTIGFRVCNPHTLTDSIPDKHVRRTQPLSTGSQHLGR
jgi:hypothetical protein